MIQLTEQQSKEIKATNGNVARALDPVGNQEYVLIRADIYLRLEKMMESEIIDPSFYEFEEIESRT